LLREKDGTPGATSLRHYLLELNYFNPDMQNTTGLRLLIEPDPVRVVVPRLKALMTRQDVVALANIYNFSKSEGNPRHRELSDHEIDLLADALDRAFGDHPKAGKMPVFHREMAVFWAGVRQQWPYLSAEEKRLTRAYAGKTWEIDLPVELYVKLFGYDRNAAARRRSNDSQTRQTAPLLLIGRMSILLVQYEGLNRILDNITLRRW
jgi:hypothetical protein